MGIRRSKNCDLAPPCGGTHRPFLCLALPQSTNEESGNEETLYQLAESGVLVRSRRTHTDRESSRAHTVRRDARSLDPMVTFSRSLSLISIVSVPKEALHGY